MKKILIRVIGAVVLLVIVAMAIVFFSLNSIVKKGVETVGPKLAKVQIRLDKASLSPFSGRGQLTGLFVGNPEGFKTPSAIQIGDIKVGLLPSSMLADVVVIDAISIQAPEVTLEEAMGGSNLEKILANLSSGSAAETPKTEKPEKKSEKKFCVKDIQIQGGKVKFSATVLQGKILPVNLPEVHLQNIGTPEKGVTAGELSTEILKVVVAKASTVAKDALAENLKGVGKESLDKATEAAKGLKNLLPK